MPTTANGLVYPSTSAAPNVPADIQALAASVDAQYGTATDYTPTLGFTNTTATVAKYQKVGDIVWVEFLLTLTGTPTGTFSITLPSGLNAAATANRLACGTVMMNDGPLDSTRRSGTVFLLSATTVSILVDSLTTAALVSTTVPWTWAAGDLIGGTFSYRAA